MSFFGRLASTVKTAYDFVQSRYPSNDPFAPVEIAQAELENTRLYSLVEYLGDVAVYQEVANKVFHVFVFCQPLAKHYSIQRTGDSKEALSLGLALSQHTVLLSFIDTEQLLQNLARELSAHPSWKSTHIAAKLGLWRFFEILEGTGDSASLTNELCIPDGLSCLHIAAAGSTCKNGRRRPSVAATTPPPRPAADPTAAAVYGNKNILLHLVAMGARTSLPDANNSNAFHHAALGDNGPAVEILSGSLDQPDCINALNQAGFTPLHLAASSRSQAAFMALLKCGASPTIAGPDGQTALEKLLNQYTPETHGDVSKCIDMIVSQSPRVLTHRDPANGATILHKITHKPVLKCLVNCCATAELLDINGRDNAGQTPLHCAVATGRLDLAVELVAAGAQVDAEDVRGWTPLHVAISNSNLLLVKAMLVFGASPDFVSDNIPVTLHFAAMLTKGPHRDAICTALKMCGFPCCVTKLPDCSHFCTGGVGKNTSMIADDVDLFNLQQCVQTTLEALKSTGPVRTSQNIPKIANLLSLDGGGIRGLVLIQVLLWLESRQKTKTPLTAKFDWISGTSTGAILAIGLATGRSLRECQRLYFRFKDVVFTGTRPYDTAVLERFLQQEFGRTATMQDFMTPRVMVTSVEGDRVPVELVFFRNYVLPPSAASQMTAINQRYHYCDPKNSFLWKVARCSSAAPSFFAPVDDKYVDGGLVANNPAMDLVADVQRHNNVLKFNKTPADCVRIGSVISVGTGHMPATAISNQFDFSLPSNYLDVVMKGFALKDMAKLLIEQVTAADGAPVDRMKAWCEMADIPYFRFSPPLSTEVPLDATDDVVLVNMLWETMDYLARQSDVEVGMALEILDVER